MQQVILMHYISSMLITGKFDMGDAFVSSTAFAAAWTGIVGYRWFKAPKREK